MIRARRSICGERSVDTDLRASRLEANCPWANQWAPVAALRKCIWSTWSDTISATHCSRGTWLLYILSCWWNVDILQLSKTSPTTDHPWPLVVLNETSMPDLTFSPFFYNRVSAIHATRKKNAGTILTHKLLTEHPHVILHL